MTAIRVFGPHLHSLAVPSFQQRLAPFITGTSYDKSKVKVLMAVVRPGWGSGMVAAVLLIKCSLAATICTIQNTSKDLYESYSV